MRIESVEILDALPVKRFGVSGLADVIIIAGPNGVGKTRLLARIMRMLRAEPRALRNRYPQEGEQPPSSSVVIRSTTDAESSAWGKTELHINDRTDLTLLRRTLQSNRRRRHWQSSILQFESNRTIQNVQPQPLAFAWDMPDPAEEVVGWEVGFNDWSSRWQDTLHSMFRLIEHQKQSIANQALRLRHEGFESMNLSFVDPMQPFKDVFYELLGPKELADLTVKKPTLQFTTADGTFDVSNLSSGEREVVNIAFDFLLRSPSDCIVFFDEPELHLHPELSHRLIQVLQAIGERNQFIFATHSPEIISSSLDKSVVFISPPDQEQGVVKNQALLVTEDDETNQALKLLGHSIGIISLGKKIVLIEGESSSLDKEVYGSLIKGRYPELVLVPSGGKHVIESFDVVQSAVLQKSLWGVEFFMLCDHDSAPTGSISDNSEARFRVLKKYHLENYFLDEVVLAEAFGAFEPVNSWLRDPEKIREKMRTLAKDLVSYAVALSVAAEIRREAGNVSVMPKECHGLRLPEITERLGKKTSTESARLNSVLDTDHIAQLTQTYYEELSGSLENDDAEWFSLIPGKPLLGKFAGAAKIQPSRLKALYLNAATKTERAPFQDIIDTFAHFASV